MRQTVGTDGVNGSDHAKNNIAEPVDDKTASTPIAIIGMSCKFPGGATSPDKLWRMCVEGRSGWSEIPKSRFNAAAFFDEDHEKTSSMNTKSGYFLEDDISAFDASFFNLSSETASAMDPQMRLQLESVYEATEDAGLPLERLAGTKTSVFAGCFVRDYNDALIQDPDTMPRTMLTGNGAAMLSNRISHFFDLRGPSMTIDTGCSTGLTAFHVGCQGLRTGDADISIVTAANMMLNPDYFIILSNLGVLSPDGRCYAWDDRANGYGRGEGIATIILKPLEQAIKDGDNVRAVVRETSINQDGKTPTITSPSAQAQEATIRDCYRRAGLDPTETPYVEAHMTGTITGDPIEAKAISNVFGQGKAAAVPVVVGSIKTNLGHLEAVSGLAGVMKAVLAIEKGLIPPNLNFERPNPAIDMKAWNVMVPIKPTAWPEEFPRRASVNNFGYGGANAHAILEAFSPSSAVLEKSACNDIKNKVADTHGLPSFAAGKLNNATSQHRVFALSSRDCGVTQRMMENLADFIGADQHDSQSLDLANLAHTLNERRSHYHWRCAVSADSASGLVSALRSATLNPVQARTAPGIGFVFTGQGAQWATMGKELFTYPVFACAMGEADDVLKSYGAEWSLIDEILKDESTSRVHEPAFSVLSVALQICMVKLLASWGISPCAVASHSSGEISAAYAVGALTFQEALGIVYLRGTLAEKHVGTSVNRGAMMAAGLGSQDAVNYANRLTKGKVVVACVNSTGSVTLSGDSDAIEELERLLQKDGIFARRLKVNAAYHSHHMLPMAEQYRQCLKQLLTKKLSWSGISYGSPVTGKLVHDVKTLGPDHWVQNLVQPVLFKTALESICVSSSQGLQVDVLLEVGPHGALAGPIRQNLSAHSLENRSISYYSCLTRKQNAVQTIQEAVCGLFNKGYSVDLASVNMVAGEKNLKTVSGLPTYPWNHTTKYWKESRINEDLRNRTHVLDELLGRSILGINPQRPSWRHFLRASDLPWLRDHYVQCDMVFPAAGMLSMAVQAMQQVNDWFGNSVEGYKIKNFDILNALVVPDTAEGVEVQLSFSPCSVSQLDDKDWWDFDLHSVTATGGSWTKHCKGSISFVLWESPSEPSHKTANTKQEIQSFSPAPLKYERAETIDLARLFAGLRSRGIYHGPSFQNMVDIRTYGDDSISTFSTRKPTRAKFVVHPTTLDSVFLAAYAALPSDAYGESVVLPCSVKEIYISSSMADHDEGQSFKAQTKIELRNNREFRSSIRVSNVEELASAPQIEVRGLYCKAAVARMVTSEESSVASKICFKTSWGVDWTLIPFEQLEMSLRFPPDLQEISVGEKLARATFYFIHDTLASLSEADISQLDWHQNLFLQWMQTQDHLGITGQLARDSSLWLDSDVSMKQQLFAEVCAESVNGRLVCRVGRSLMDILRHKTTPLELMMHGNLLFDFYEQAIGQHRSYAQVKHLVTHFAYKTPNGKILEIGGGTGGCTTSVLEALSGDASHGDHHFSRYDFTDISSGFFEKAAIKFSRWSDLMTFKKLDIEREPLVQGFELGSYDLIIACQVLHATKNMERTMFHVRQLLKPGGKLIMVETTRDTPDVQLIFGTLPGWWLGEGRNDSPNMPVQSWREILTATGFNGLNAEIGDCDSVEHYSISTMLATASSPSPRYPKVLSIIVPLGFSRAWLEDLKASITRATGIPTVEEDLTAAGLNGNYCLYLLEMGKPLLSRLDSETFDSIRRTLTSSPGGLWVTSGGLMDGMDPDYAIHAGLLRTLRLEDATKRLISCDLPRQNDPCTAESCRVITDIVRSTFDLNVAADSIDLEYAARGSDIYVARVFEDPGANDATLALSKTTCTELKGFVGSSMPLRVDVETIGNLESIRFVEDETMYAPLDNGFIEIEPKAFGANFRDVLVALGHIDGTTIGFECSGVVTKLGPDTEQSGLRVGDRVCAIMQGHYGTPVRLHWTWVGQISDATGYEEAASIPMAFITAYQSLYESARMKEGETILIHAAAGAVGQAAIMLAQHRKAEIFVTVGTDVKRSFIMETYGIPADHISSSRDVSFASMIMEQTGGKGVDIVLNSLSGKLLKASWDCIASFGRFIEIGKRDIEQNKSLDMAPLRRAASFAAVDLNHMMLLRGDLVAKAFRQVLRLWDFHHIKAVTPVKRFPISKLVGALKFMQSGKHLGKIVIVPEPSDLVKTLSPVEHVKLKPDASYLLVGGIGGIGRSLARHLAVLGCKSLIMVSRFAEKHEAVPELVKKLACMGCKVFIRNCDVANASDLTSLLDTLRDTNIAPIRGVIQAAMALQDSIFERMTFEQWRAALRPKHAATWNLHNQIPNLDFFVMLSSITGVAGSPGQANYAAGSVFQDAFAKWRTSQGLPAVSINLGPVKDVGYVAGKHDVLERLLKLGFQPLEKMDTMRIIELAMLHPCRPLDLSQVITGFREWEAETDVAWGRDLRLSTLRKISAVVKKRNSGLAGFNTAASFKESVARATTLEQATQHCTNALVQKVADMFSLQVTDVDPSLSLASYGVDSLVAVEMRNWLAITVAADLSIFDIMQSSSVASLSAKVAQKIQHVPASVVH